jgi:hypothetical protein
MGIDELKNSYHTPIKGPPGLDTSFKGFDESLPPTSLDQRRSFVAKMKSHAWGWLRVWIIFGLVVATLSKSATWGASQFVVSEMDSPLQNIVSIG